MFPGKINWHWCSPERPIFCQENIVYSKMPLKFNQINTDTKPTTSQRHNWLFLPRLYDEQFHPMPESDVSVMYLVRLAPRQMCISVTLLISNRLECFQKRNLGNCTVKGLTSLLATIQKYNSSDLFEERASTQFQCSLIV